MVDQISNILLPHISSENATRTAENKGRSSPLRLLQTFSKPGSLVNRRNVHPVDGTVGRGSCRASPPRKRLGGSLALPSFAKDRGFQISKIFQTICLRFSLLARILARKEEL
jgi:hypothetical protein